MAKIAAVPVRTISEKDLTRNSSSHGAFDHPERQLDFGFEGHLVGNVCFGSALRGIGPALRQIQLEVDRGVLRSRRDLQADPDLAIGDLAGRSRVLTLYSRRMHSLFEKARVVHHPGRHLLLLCHRFADMSRRLEPYRRVTPTTAAHEVQQLFVHVTGLLWVA